MSKRVYLSKTHDLTTRLENPPVRIRIQRSHATVKALHSRLQQAYRRDDVRLVRRTTLLIDLLVHHVPVAVLSNVGASAPLASIGGAKTASCTGSTAWSTAMAAVASRSAPPDSRNAWWS